MGDRDLDLENDRERERDRDREGVRDIDLLHSISLDKTLN
jgi:hypothetical protein